MVITILYNKCFPIYFVKIITMVITILYNECFLYIRYEDCLSCPGRPFSSGVTMSSLSVVSTDSSYCQRLDTDILVYKVSCQQLLSAPEH